MARGPSTQEKRTLYVPGANDSSRNRAYGQYITCTVRYGRGHSDSGGKGPGSRQHSGVVASCAWVSCPAPHRRAFDIYVPIHRRLRLTLCTRFRGMRVPTPPSPLQLDGSGLLSALYETRLSSGEKVTGSLQLQATDLSKPIKYGFAAELA